MTTKQKLIIASGLVAVAVFGRLVPHLWNMTPIGAVAILSGARLGWKWGMALPLVGMIVGDMFLGFYSMPIMIAVYASFALAGVVGFYVGKVNKASIVVGGSVLGALIFFLITNAAVWAFGTMYAHNFYGLLASYIAGLPFFQNQIVGDMFFTSALFALWELYIYVSESFKFKFAE